MSRDQIQLTKEATHWLESQGQALSVGTKSSSPWRPLTSWRAEDRHCQQGPNPAHHRSHSHPREQRTGIIRREQIHLTMKATHLLESRGHTLSAETKSSSPQRPLTNWRAKAGEPRTGIISRDKSSSPEKPLTFWRAEDRHCQQGPNPAHHRSHSLPAEQRTSIVSRDQIQLITKATHFLE